MARRTTDLLDVFRDRGTAGRPAKGDAPAPAEARAAKKPFEGLFLFPRQLLLGSSVVVLLLVFAFVLGLTMGRRGSSGGGNALQGSVPRADASTPDVRRLYVSGRVPVTNATTLATNDPQKLFDTLTSSRYGVDSERLWITGDSSGKQWVVILGPFDKKQDAIDYLVSHGLLTVRVGGVYPFQSPGYGAQLASTLPRQRVPNR